MKNLIYISFFCFSSLISAQNPCKPNKKFQSILEKSKVFENEYFSSISVFSSDITYVKIYEKTKSIDYKVCDLKIEKDSLFIKGFFKTKRNLFHDSYFFQTGNKIDTTTLITLGIDLYMGPFDAFYLDNIEYQSLYVLEELILPRKLKFQIKLPIHNQSLFTISNSSFIADIFDLNALRKNLQVSNFQ